jgi:hypothetical protein
VARPACERARDVAAAGTGPRPTGTNAQRRSAGGQRSAEGVLTRSADERGGAAENRTAESGGGGRGRASGSGGGEGKGRLRAGVE